MPRQIANASDTSLPERRINAISEWDFKDI
jgi:hypothetical protein